METKCTDSIIVKALCITYNHIKNHNLNTLYCLSATVFHKDIKKTEILYEKFYNKFMTTGSRFNILFFNTPSTENLIIGYPKKYYADI